MLDQLSDGKLRQSQFQQDRFVLEKIEAMTRDTGTCLQIQQLMFFGECHMVEGLEIELGFGPPRSHRFGISFLSQGRIGMGHVRDGH